MNKKDTKFLEEINQLFKQIPTIVQCESMNDALDEVIKFIGV